MSKFWTFLTAAASLLMLASLPAAAEGNQSEWLERAFAASVVGLIVPGVGPATWEALLEWPRRDRRVQVGLGIHPQFLPELDEGEDEKHLATLDSLLGRGGAIAVGECGLDGPTEVRIQAEPGVEVHYTLDGSAPTKSDPVYAAPIRLDSATVVRARGYKPGSTRSIPVQAVFVVGG